MSNAIPTRQLVFVDTEYSNLDTSVADLIEVAYAVEDGPVISGIPPHVLAFADPQALEVNRYYERGLDTADRDHFIIRDVLQALRGNTLVAANPRVDATMLSRHGGGETWHYRLLDVESAAMLILGFDHVPSLRDIREDLTLRGYSIPAPDHSAAADVTTLRACFRALQDIARVAGLPS